VKARALAAAMLCGLVAVGCGGASGAGSGDGTRPAVGLQDDRLGLATSNASSRVLVMSRLGAKLIRVDMRWDIIAPHRPRHPRNPNDPVYRWRHWDEVVAAARAHGIKVLFTVWGTPRWAADTSVKPSANPAIGPWSRRPLHARDYDDFAAAAARRYAPRGVHRWEAWNEPNIPLFLRPQFHRVGSRWVPESPAIYAGLLNAFYRGVKSADPKAVVGGGVTAPAGDPNPQTCTLQPDCRVKPTSFVLRLAALHPRMDVYSHHPYPITPPRTRSFPGASYVDLYNLDVLERTLDKTSLRGKALWLTEFGFQTTRSSQYPLTVTESQQATYLADALRRVQANPRVRIFVWYLMQDSPNWGSGLLRQNGTRKPAASVFKAAASASAEARR